jgi:hypothetical protein
MDGDTMNEGYQYQQKVVYEYLIKQGLSENEASYVVNKISNAIRQRVVDRDCCDNFRISVNGKNDGKYNAIRENGCCGFWDDKVTLKSGIVVKFGFNYGH